MTCKICGKKLDIRNKTGHCQKCFVTHLHRGEGHSRWKGGKAIKFCELCGVRVNYRSTRCIKCSLKGKPKSEEHKRKNSLSKIGKPGWWQGKKRSIEERIILSILCKGRPAANKGKTIPKLAGVNNPNWRGGTTFEDYGKEFNSELRESIRFREGYKCFECGCPQIENKKQLDVHHIDFNKKNNSNSNLVALCKYCHGKTQVGREKWTKYFQYKLEGALR